MLGEEAFSMDRIAESREESIEDHMVTKDLIAPLADLTFVNRLPAIVDFVEPPVAPLDNHRGLRQIPMWRVFVKKRLRDRAVWFFWLSLFPLFPS